MGMFHLVQSVFFTTLQLSNHLQVKKRLAGDSVATVQFKNTWKITPFFQLGGGAQLILDVFLLKDMVMNAEY